PPSPPGRASSERHRRRGGPRADCRGAGRKRGAGRDGRRRGRAHARPLDRRRHAPGGVTMKGMKHSFLKASASAIAAFVLLAGCGLISSDISKLTFDLPTETYTFDTAMWSNLPKGTIPAIPCSTSDQCCTAGSLAGIDCSMTMLTCNSSMVCEAEVP